MRSAVGIICEYDPFHRGHAKQIAMIREAMPEAIIVCLMSGCFTQRGAPALFSPTFRARQALLAGADLVLELPCLYSVRDAEHFTLSGVNLLNRLHFITHLCFGCESGIDRLHPIAELLEHSTEPYTKLLRQYLSEGLPYPAAEEKALCELAKDASVLKQPNNILAICYLRALDRTKSSILPMPILRAGAYHDEHLTDLQNPSATAIRKAFAEGRMAEAENACGYSLRNQVFARPDALDSLLLWKLRTSTAEELARLPGCTEGLENRLISAAAQSASREELLQHMKTRRYPYARLSRLCCHALLDMKQELVESHPIPEYVRILGLKPGAWTAVLKDSSISVLSKATDGNREDSCFHLDLRAWELWALAAGLPAGLIFREPMVVVK